jgi:hypothetical protein
MPLASEAFIALAGGFEFLDAGGGREEILSHVAALAEERLELFEDEKYFAVVLAGLVLWLDVDGADLTAVLPAPARLCVW